MPTAVVARHSHRQRRGGRRRGCRLWRQHLHVADRIAIEAPWRPLGDDLDQHRGFVDDDEVRRHGGRPGPKPGLRGRAPLEHAVDRVGGNARSPPPGGPRGRPVGAQRAIGTFAASASATIACSTVSRAPKAGARNEPRACCHSAHTQQNKKTSLTIWHNCDISTATCRRTRHSDGVVTQWERREAFSGASRNPKP